MNRIKQVLTGLRRNVAMVMATVILIFLTLLILGFALVLTINARDISSNVVENLTMHVFVDPNADDGDVDVLVNEISGLEGVESIELSNKEEQLHKVLDPYGEEMAPIVDMFSGENNPLKDVLEVFTVEGTDMDALSVEIENFDYVDKADYGKDFGADKVIKIMNQISFISLVSAIIFAIITMFLIVNTIKLTINSRRKEIEIMRLVGATKSYITFPFAFEGALLGLVGGIIAFLVLFSLYIKVSTSTFGMFLTPPSFVMWYLFAGQIIFGMAIGLLGSVVAIRNYLKV